MACYSTTVAIAFQQAASALAAGIGHTQPPLVPCIPGSPPHLKASSASADTLDWPAEGRLPAPMGLQQSLTGLGGSCCQQGPGCLHLC